MLLGCPQRTHWRLYGTAHVSVSEQRRTELEKMRMDALTRVHASKCFIYGLDDKMVPRVAFIVAIECVVYQWAVAVFPHICQRKDGTGAWSWLCHVKYKLSVSYFSHLMENFLWKYRKYGIFEYKFLDDRQKYQATPLSDYPHRRGRNIQTSPLVCGWWLFIVKGKTSSNLNMPN